MSGFLSASEIGGDDDDEEMTSGNKNTFTCKHCKKEFTLKGNLKRHILTHAGVKPYICGICNKGFSRKADLEIHNRVHTGEKPYECPAPGCGKRFARISDLRSHERTHRYVRSPIPHKIVNRPGPRYVMGGSRPSSFSG